MKTTIEALKEVYVAMGGELTAVADIVTIPDMIEALSTVASGDDGKGAMIVNISGEYVTDAMVYSSDKTAKEIYDASHEGKPIIAIYDDHDPDYRNVSVYQFISSIKFTNIECQFGICWAGNYNQINAKGMTIEGKADGTNNTVKLYAETFKAVPNVTSGSDGDVLTIDDGNLVWKAPSYLGQNAVVADITVDGSMVLHCSMEYADVMTALQTNGTKVFFNTPTGDLVPVKRVMYVDNGMKYKAESIFTSVSVSSNTLTADVLDLLEDESITTSTVVYDLTPHT